MGFAGKRFALFEILGIRIPPAQQGGVRVRPCKISGVFPMASAPGSRVICVKADDEKNFRQRHIVFHARDQDGLPCLFHGGIEQPQHSSVCRRQVMSAKQPEAGRSIFPSLPTWEPRTGPESSRP